MAWYEIVELFGVLLFLATTIYAAILERENAKDIAINTAALAAFDTIEINKRIDNFYDALTEANGSVADVRERMVKLETAFALTMEDDDKPSKEPPSGAGHPR